MQHVGVTDPQPRVSRGGGPLMIASAVPLEITAPTIEYGLLAPVLLIFVGACLGVLAEALAPRERRRRSARHHVRCPSRWRW